MGRAWRCIWAIGLVATASCSSREAPSVQPVGPGRPEVCQAFMIAVQREGQVAAGEEASISDRTVTRSDAADQVAQHRGIARSMRKLARWARDTDDAALADSLSSLGIAADRVLRQLRRTTDANEAQAIASGLYAQTAQLYADCNAEVYQEALRRGAMPLSEGPCAAAGAPKLRGDVFVYGGGEDFTDARCVLVRGRRIKDGCAFSGPDAELSPEGGPIASVEVATNHTTCRSLYVVGRPPP